MISRLSLTGLSLGGVTILLWTLLSANPDWAEFIYARKIYPLIAGALSHVGNALPIAVTGWIHIIGALILLIIPYAHFKNRKSKFFWMAPAFLSMLSFVCTLVFLLCVTFMFNHLRYTEEQLFGLDFELTEEMYNKLVGSSVAEANRLSPGFAKDARGCTLMNLDLQGMDTLIKLEQTNFLDTQQLPALIDANTRYFYFSEQWSGMHLAGQYQPLVGQPNIARAVPDLAKPEIIAHERAHLNGFASEAGANLLAIQTLLHAGADQLRYLGLIELWRKQPPEGLNEFVKADLQCLADDWASVHRYKIDFITREINDFYLKLAGQEDGVESYNRGTMLGLKYYYKHFVPEADKATQ